MQFRSCSVVDGDTIASFVKNLNKTQSTSSMVELRADFIKGLKAEDVKKLKTKAATSIFTCRHIKENGKFSGSFKEQADVLKAAFKAGFTYVDISYDNPIIEELTPKEKKKLIISYHNFKVTPASIELVAILERMRENDPAIVKISAMVKSPKDIFPLVEVLKRRKDNEKIIVIGMGDAGRLTRVMFPMMGSYLTYVSANSKPAPGMMSQKELESVYKIIAKS